MLTRQARLRWRRRLRSTSKNVQAAQQQAAEHLDKHVIRRWQKFADVRRFVVGWLILIGLLLFGVSLQNRNLSQFYQHTVRAAGGIYTEGVVGETKNLNPIFATSAPDRTATRLLFDPLIEYDSSAQLKPALAASWQINQAQTTYTLKLRSGALWHDGRPITSYDVVYTFTTIQHPDTGSPLQRSWRDVRVEAPDESTVVFTLPNAFTPFLQSLTNVGILPSHILEEVPLTELRAHPFNLSPNVGSGPFTFANMTLEATTGEVRLTRFDQYYEGKPQLSEFIIHSYFDHEEMIEAFNEGTIMGASGLRTQDLTMLPEETDRYRLYTPRLFNNVLLFFNSSDAPYADKDFRLALVQATNTRAIFDRLGHHYPESDAPLLNDQLGYNQRYVQLGYDKKKAGQLLDKLGWKLKSDDGLRYKNDQVLELTLITQNSDEYPIVAEEIQRQWRELGIILKLELVNPDKLQQDFIAPHTYSLLLLGVDQGVDSDVFVYWHSSEARVEGFNLSEYKNNFVDAALEAGRTRLDVPLRRAKYEAFLQQWRADAPAVALYRPVFFYTQLNVVDGFEAQAMPDSVDRLSNVEKWTILTEKVNKTL